VRQKVIDCARDLGLELHVTTLGASTRTVSEAAAAVGCGEAQIAKSIVFVADGEPVVAVTSGAHRVDLDALCDAVDCAEVRTATPDEVMAATGFGVGGVPPFAHDLPVVMDEALLGHETVWAAGGDGNTVFAVDPKLLARRMGARVVHLGD
jgi:prolyl-tRNA editing enzyme YbaK/EbsC (Cys-tRNA(Pro) deacylase)